MMDFLIKINAFWKYFQHALSLLLELAFNIYSYKLLLVLTMNNSQ